MFNQLSASSGRNIYREFLKESQLSEPIQASPKQQSSLKGKKERLLDRLIVNSMEELESSNLSNAIKARLRSKKIDLPTDFSILPRDNTLNIDSNIPRSNKQPYSNSIHHGPSSRTRKRLKTQLSDLVDESQTDSVRPYEQAMDEIDDLNRMFYRNNKRKPVKYTDFSIPQSYSPPPRRLDHLSRGRDFDRYVNHLERLQLHRSELRHYRRNQSPAQYYPSPTKMRLPDISPKYKTEEKVEKQNSPVSPELIKKDNFIKVLKKVKARGESLLVKLRKFPSDRKLKA